MSNIILYHGGGCQDGFMSAYVMNLFFKEINEEAEFIAVNYNKPIPDVTGKDVFIVDFSYHPDVLKEASKTAKSILMLDHHLLASQQWGSYGNFIIPKSENTCEINVLIVKEMSGVGLAMDFAYEKFHRNQNSFIYNDRLVQIVDAIQDRDLWLFKYPDTLIIYEMISAMPSTFEALDNLIFQENNIEYEFKLREAESFVKIKEKLAQDYAAKFQLINFQGYEIPIVNVPANFSSRVGEILYQKHPFALMYCLSTTKVFCSLRSDSKSGMNVCELAEKFKGGGHFNSAGFGLTPDELPNLLKGLL